MAFQSVPETVEIDHIFTLHGVTVQNVHYARLPGGYAQADLQTMAGQIDGIFPATWVTEVDSDVTYVRTEVRGLEFENDLTAQDATSTGPGTHVGSSLPNNVTFAIKKSSGLTGRSARGRTFWIGVPSNETEPTDENFLLAAYAALIVADVDFVRISINALASWEAVLVSRFSGGAKRAVGVTFPWLSTSNVDLRVDTNRSRLPAT